MFTLLRKPVLLVLGCLLFASLAVAQNNRSAVSVAGDDAASCTVPDPCRTFSMALSKTNNNGEVVALTSGGYGPFTITKPATIVAAPGIYAALVATAGSAISVNAGAGAKVVIRGLHLYGMGTGSAGISVNSAEEVHIEHCVIDGFSNHGIFTSMNVRVSDTTIRRCSFGIWIDNVSAAVKGTVNRVTIRDITNMGIMAHRNATVTVRQSLATDCASIGFNADIGQLNIEDSLVTNSSFAVVAQVGGVVRVSNTMATDNGTGFYNDVGATFVSWGNNRVQGNTTNKTGTITVVPQN